MNISEFLRLLLPSHPTTNLLYVWVNMAIHRQLTRPLPTTLYTLLFPTVRGFPVRYEEGSHPSST